MAQADMEVEHRGDQTMRSTQHTMHRPLMYIYFHLWIHILDWWNGSNGFAGTYIKLFRLLSDIHWVNIVSLFLALGEQYNLQFKTVF